MEARKNYRSPKANKAFSADPILAAPMRKSQFILSSPPKKRETMAE